MAGALKQGAAKVDHTESGRRRDARPLKASVVLAGCLCLDTGHQGDRRGNAVDAGAQRAAITRVGRDKAASVIRKHTGYGHSAALHAGAISRFYRDNLNMLVNLASAWHAGCCEER
jgi:hypothetical protein